MSLSILLKSFGPCGEASKSRVCVSQSEAARFAITGWETLELGGKSSVAGTHGAQGGGHLGSNQAKIIPS